MPLTASAFRGLGCRSVTEVSSPEAVVRASADWHGKSVRRKKQRSAGSGVVAPDVWCTPGVGSAADVDCVVARRPAGNLSDRGRLDGQPAAGEVCSNSREKLPYDQNILETPHLLPEFPPLGRFQGSHRSLGELCEIIMFQNRLSLGRLVSYDKYKDLRIDVDNMSYEDLLKLSDKIGYVSTGLKEKEIMSCLKKMKRSKYSSGEIKCSICQEEYEVNEDIRKLGCGHSYHFNCIKEWLSHKKTCPICKKSAIKG